MSFDLPKPTKEKVGPQRPSWCEHENEILVFDAVVSRINEIEDDITNSSSPLSPSKVKIAKSAICKQLGLSPSYINKHKDMNGWVDREQRRLKRSAESANEKAVGSAAIKASHYQMNRADLLKLVIELRRELDKRRSEIYVSQLNRLLDAGMTESQLAMEQIIKRLEDENQQLRETSGKMSANISHLQKEVIAANKKIHELNSKKSASVVAVK